jgi:hypothetical protein
VLKAVKKLEDDDTSKCSKCRVGRSEAETHLLYGGFRSSTHPTLAKEKAKAYQVKQVLKAVKKLEDDDTSKCRVGRSEAETHLLYGGFRSSTHPTLAPLTNF